MSLSLLINGSAVNLSSVDMESIVLTVTYNGTNELRFREEVRHYDGSWDADSVVELRDDSTTVFKGWIVDNPRKGAGGEYVEYLAQDGRYRADIVTVVNSMGVPRKVFNADPEDQDYTVDEADQTIGDILTWLFDTFGDDLQRRGIPHDYESTDLSAMTDVPGRVAFVNIGFYKAVILVLDQARKFRCYIDPDTLKWRFYDIDSMSTTTIQYGNDPAAQVNILVSLRGRATAVKIVGDEQVTDETLYLSDADLTEAWDSTLEDTWTIRKVYENDGVVTVVDYSQIGGGDTVTITVDEDETVLTEGVDWDAETDNDTTAENIRVAIDALDHLAATRTDAVVTVVPALDHAVSALTTDCAAAALTVSLDWSEGYGRVARRYQIADADKRKMSRTRADGSCIRVFKKVRESGDVWVPVRAKFLWNEGIFITDEPLLGYGADPEIEGGYIAVADVKLVYAYLSDALTVRAPDPSTVTVTVVDYSLIDSGSVVGVVVRVSGEDATTNVVEGTDWDAATSNDATATSLASAMDGVTGISASAAGAVVTISDNTGTIQDCTTNALRTAITIAGVYEGSAYTTYGYAVEKVIHVSEFRRSAQSSDMQTLAQTALDNLKTPVWSGSLSLMGQQKWEWVAMDRRINLSSTEGATDMESIEAIVATLTINVRTNHTQVEFTSDVASYGSDSWERELQLFVERQRAIETEARSILNTRSQQGAWCQHGFRPSAMENDEWKNDKMLVYNDWNGSVSIGQAVVGTGEMYEDGNNEYPKVTRPETDSQQPAYLAASAASEQGDLFWVYIEGARPWLDVGTDWTEFITGDQLGTKAASFSVRRDHVGIGEIIAVRQISVPLNTGEIRVQMQKVTPYIGVKNEYDGAVTRHSIVEVLRMETDGEEANDNFKRTIVTRPRADNLDAASVLIMVGVFSAQDDIALARKMEDGRALVRVQRFGFKQVGGMAANDGGVATGGTNTTIVDNRRNWDADMFEGGQATVTIDGAGETKNISGNTANTITAGAVFSRAIAENDNYIVRKSSDSSGTATGGTTTTCVDTGQSWPTNMFAGGTITVTHGTTSEDRAVTGNNATTITVGSAFSFTVTAGDTYLVRIDGAEAITYVVGEAIRTQAHSFDGVFSNSNGIGTVSTGEAAIDIYGLAALTIDVGKEPLYNAYVNDTGQRVDPGHVVSPKTVSREMANNRNILQEDVNAYGRQKVGLPADNDPKAEIVVKGADNGDIVLTTRSGTVTVDVDGLVGMGQEVGAKNNSPRASPARKGLGKVASLIGGVKVTIASEGE